MDKVLIILLEVVLAAFHVLQLSAEGKLKNSITFQDVEDTSFFDIGY